MEARSLRNKSLKIGFVLLAVTMLIAVFLFVSPMAVLAFSPEYVTWTEYPSNPVFDPPESAYYPSIIFSGSTYYMWYDDGGGIRYTTSVDGISWVSGAICTGLTNARHPVVKWVGSGYRIWYWDSGGNLYYSINDIRTAVSPDGITWNSDRVIAQTGGATVIAGPGPYWNNGSYGPCEVFYNPAGSGAIVPPISAPTVWQNKFVMYYDGTTGSFEDIGIAVSADGITWQGYNNGAAPVLLHGGGSTWDSNYATMCSVQKINGLYHMWYSGGQSTSHEGIGYAQSLDGITWTKYTSNPIMHISDSVSWRTDRTYTPRVLYDSANFSGAGESVHLKMWYNGTSGSNYAIGYSGNNLPEPEPTTTTTPAAIGGQVYPADKRAILMPYIYVLISINIIIIGGLVWKKLTFARTNRWKS
ncbi:MAG: hypothetical protein ABR954_08560 [Dehalococcoidales bacterium]